MSKIFYLIGFTILFFSGCAHVVSPELKEKSDQDITFADLQLNPEAHEGEIVVLGGVIVQTMTTEDGSLIEIYQTRTDARGRPVDLDISRGRFLVFSSEMLDPEIFRQGRRVTVAAMVEGERMGRIGEADYLYPYLTALEIHLWEERKWRYEPYPYRDPWHPRLSPYRHSPFHRDPWWW